MSILILLVTKGHMQNFRTLGQSHLGVETLDKREGRKKIENKNAVKSGHYVLSATPKGIACTSLGPI